MAADKGETRTGKIDMGHGFMRHIVKNQVDRDDYDKEVKLAKMQQKPHRRTPGTGRPKKPDLAYYTPPSRKTECTTDCLFKLEFESDSGEIYDFEVIKVLGENAAVIAKRLGDEIGLDSTLIKALEVKINEEIEKRNDR
ncbi:UPF0561 protein C2orf68 homolog [Glandiceps talaboti]